MCNRDRDSMTPRLFTVTAARKETQDTFTIDLRPPDGVDGFKFAPGQFNMLYMFGMGEVPVSISGDPGRPDILTHTIRAVGSVTRPMLALKRGATVGVRGPYGVGWPMDRAEGKDVVIVAGGIGLAPLRSTVLTIIANRERYGKVVLLYGARTPEDMIYRREIAKWRGWMDIELETTVDRGTGGWRGHVGVVTTLIPRVSFDPENSVAMMCGPEVMMRFTVMEFAKLGVAMENIYVSMERNMKCGVGLCGHCQFGPYFVCKDGPVFASSDVMGLMGIREV